MSSIPDSENIRAEDLSLGDVLLRMPKLTPQQWQGLPLATRWLVMVRAAVLVMTASSVLVGVLLALMDGAFHLDRLIALLIGLVGAHATNNLINDLVDSRQGLDSDNYFRRQYGAHVLEQGLVSEGAFKAVIAATGLTSLVAGLWLSWQLGPAVLYLTLAGAFFVLFYTWPLKYFALGEFSVLLVWGPLMTAGSYFVMTGELTGVALALSFVYGVGPTLVIMGKHIDKCDQDAAKGVRSLPVVLGERRARFVSLALLALQWLLLVALVVFDGAPAWLMICLFSLPAMLGVIRGFVAPRPASAPTEYPAGLWPLWFSAMAFRYSRDFGLLLVVALGICAAIA